MAFADLTAALLGAIGILLGAIMQNEAYRKSGRISDNWGALIVVLGAFVMMIGIGLFLGSLFGFLKFS